MGCTDRSRWAACLGLALWLVGACSRSDATRETRPDAGRPDAGGDPWPIPPYGGEVWLTRMTDETGATRAQLTALFISESTPESVSYPLLDCEAVQKDDIWPAGLPPDRTYADPGTITVTLPGGEVTADQPAPGLDFLGRYHKLLYTADLPADALAPNDDDQFDLGDLQPFLDGSPAVFIPPAYQPIAPATDQALTLDPTADLEVTWEVPDRSDGFTIVLGVVGFFNQLGVLTHLCQARAEAGTLTIPAATLADLSPSGRMLRGLMSITLVTTTTDLWEYPRAIDSSSPSWPPASPTPSPPPRSNGAGLSPPALRGP